jgi:endoglycosylceramidase
MQNFSVPVFRSASPFDCSSKVPITPRVSGPHLLPHSLARFILTIILGIALQGCSNSNDNNAIQEEPSVTSLPWVTVSNFRLVDAWGREVSIRGINARIEGLFDVTFEDGRIPLEPIPEFTREDAEAMVRYGFNVLRLPINWSGLEPHEGQFSDAYFQKLDQVINLARDAGLYVLLDFHQDAWSKEIGEDGAPLWAIVPPPDQLLEGPLDDLAERRFSPQVFNAFKGFFENQEGIQDRFLPVWKRLVGRYADRAEIIGFEPMNEPLTFDPSQQVIYDFYQKLLPAMRELDDRHMLWMEPDVVRNFGNSAPLLAEPFPDGNIVYCPHIYPMGVDASTYEEWKTWLDENFSNMKSEANSWGGALVVGEWGVHPDDAEAPGYIQAVQEAAEELSSGQMLWLWKEDSQGSWGFYDFDVATDNWVVRDNAVRLFGKPYALAVPGTLLSHHFDPEAQVLSFSFETQGDEQAGPLLYLPEFWFDGLPTIYLNGSTVGYERDASSQRVLLDWSGETGRFDVEVR